MRTRTENQDTVFIVTLDEKRLDAALVPDFISSMKDWIEGGKQIIVLDLSLVDFIDSTGLGALVACLKKHSNHGKFTLCGVSEKIMSLFKLTRMDQVFTIYPNRETAISALLS